MVKCGGQQKLRLEMGPASQRMTNRRHCIRWSCSTRTRMAGIRSSTEMVTSRLPHWTECCPMRIQSSSAAKKFLRRCRNHRLFFASGVFVGLGYCFETPATCREYWPLCVALCPTGFQSGFAEGHGTCISRQVQLSTDLAAK